jgi:pimeloyl-ACP methyl ester carboxylesterase
LTGEAVASLEEKVRKAYGVSQSDSSEIVRRRLHQIDNDHYSFLSDLGTIEGIRQLYEDFLEGQSFFDLLRAIDVPSLIIRANRLSLPPQLPEWHRELLQAYFLGVRKQTEALMHSSQLTVSVRENSHMMMLEDPIALAGEITQFLAGG